MPKLNVIGLAEDIVRDLELDLVDRAGLGNEWDQLDKETLNEIREIWTQIIIEKIESASWHEEDKEWPEEMASDLIEIEPSGSN